MSLASETERAAHLERRRAFNVAEPHACFVEPERTHTGEIVPVSTVLLRNRECPWRCIYCDLWKETTIDAVPAGAIPTQIDAALRQPGVRDARQIKLYNAGSFFDPGAIPPADDLVIARSVQHYERVIVESHPAFVGDRAAHFSNLLLQVKLEVAMGLEVADDSLLARLNKRMTVAQFRVAAEFLRERDIAVRAFIIVKPPFVTSDQAALELAIRSVVFAFEAGAEVVTLIPARFGPDALKVLSDSGEFAVPKLSTVEAAMDHGIALQRGRIFVDLWDASQVRACPNCRPQRVERLRAMNFSQQPVPRIECVCGF